MKKAAVWMLIALCLSAGGVQAAPDTAAGPASPAPEAKRCPPDTGSRIARQPDAQGRCTPSSPGLRSYTTEDIDRTGALTLSDALGKLDPQFLGR